MSIPTKPEPTRLYGRRWGKSRKQFLAHNPLCVACKAAGKVTPAAVVDHIIPYKGDSRLFWDEKNWQPLCKTHHDHKTAREDRAASTDGAPKMRGCAPDGTPLNPKHPWADGGSVIPRSLPKPAIPVHMVCGPPGVGKSTFVAAHADPADVILDLDTIRAQLSGRPLYHADISWLDAALKERNARLAALADATSGRAWLIIGCPNAAERQEWRALLGPGITYLLIAPERTCIRRCRADRRRPYEPGRWERAIASWFRQYKPTAGDREVDMSGPEPDSVPSDSADPRRFVFA